MMKSTAAKIIAVNLFIGFILVLVYPHLMISPGKLLDGHQDLTTDCFACHTPFLRSSPKNCMACHKPKEIGKLKTTGEKIIKQADAVAFHQKLIEQDCVACHSDHQGLKVYRKIHHFSHQLVMESVRKECSSCHKNPDDRLHKKLKLNCNVCHTSDEWKPASFEHEKYFRSVGSKQCTGCHQKPDDRLHRQLKGKCDICHSLDKWKPATFDHDEYFRFDKDHETDCITCHESNDYSQYTCYGCHEHSRRNIREEHIEEGIRDYEECTECHRSGDEDEAERIWKSKRGLSGKYWKRDHDDDDD
ncbi:MAG: class III cytochrome C family protein [Gammaproteobacteria bacterium]|nr:class III cytochrome C family protein [Gammaproteobacteria bacterium]